MPAIRRALDYGLVLESAEALGAMQAAFDLTRDYLRTRPAIWPADRGLPGVAPSTGGHVHRTGAGSLIVLRGLAALIADGADRAALAAATRARVAQAARYVGGQAIQLHGGIGVAEEYP
ncbi:acyl-CoA dehydrogenase family protein [Sphingomonas sp. MMS24-JH45]